MTVGTKSILFGAHQFLLHPFFVAEAWRRLYGFPWNPRLWVAFFVHDIGYLGKPNMDGPEGEQHVELGAMIMGWFFGEQLGHLCLYHSRFYAKKAGVKISRLGIADKLSIVLTPYWLYLPLVRLSGEWHEYVAQARNGKYSSMNLDDRNGLRAWFLSVQDYLARWVEEHKDGREDTWTPNEKE